MHDQAPSVLMVAGGGFADRAICAQARQLSRYGSYRYSAIGVDSGRGRPGVREDDLFDSVARFPLLEMRPSDAAGWARLAGAALRSLGPSGPGPVGASGRATLAERWRYRLERAHWAREMPRLAEGHDICHWHALAPHRLPALDWIPPSTRVVVTVWGSDVLRASGLERYRRQVRACERADRITVNSVEMRELLLARLGRGFAEKIRMAAFGSELYDAIDARRGEPERNRARLGLPQDKVVVCVGNNGVELNQHLAVLDSLATLGEEVRQRLVLVLPMTYGTESDYAQRLRKKGAECGIEFVVLDEPLSHEDMAGLRCAADVVIHVPETDAFSASMCEHLYGGGVLLTGAWLPYGPLRRQGIHHHAVETIAEVSGVLERVLDRFSEERERAAETGRAVRVLACWKHVASQWIDLYDELIGLPRPGFGAI